MYSNNRVCVLLATYNGAPWLAEQVHSIAEQESCTIDIVVSDDCSSDSTVSILNELQDTCRISILKSTKRYGSANANFIRLICDADIGDADFVALSDQDDIWCSNKISRAIEVLESTDYVCYSSDVIAFWNNGKRKYIKKSYKQKDYDYIFESAGPGCTFVLKKSFFYQLRKWFFENRTVVSSFKVHDWLIYSYARSHGFKWYIDDRPMLFYRQHMNNEIGANSGVRAYFKRFIFLLNGQYFNDASRLIDIVNYGPATPIKELINAENLSGSYKFIYLSKEFRRSYIDVCVLRLCFILRQFVRMVYVKP